MARRSYQQFCGLATALDLVGERWTLLVVRDLALGPRRYSDLLAGLGGIGTNLLAERLRSLEEADIVRRTELQTPGSAPGYELTDSGRELAEAMLPLAVWGAKRLDFSAAGLSQAVHSDGVQSDGVQSDGVQSDGVQSHSSATPSTFRPDWLFLALRSRFRPEQAVGIRETYEFDVRTGDGPGTVVHVRVRDGEVSLGRGRAPEGADLVITTDPATLYALGVGKAVAADVVASGAARIEGSPEALAHCAAILGDGGRFSRAGAPGSGDLGDERPVREGPADSGSARDG